MKRRGACALLAASLLACATRGHIATPQDLARLNQAEGLKASGRLSLRGPRGAFSTAVIFGLARPDSLRLEIPGGTGLRFLLLAREGKLRADLPGDDAMFEGAATREVMNALFGIDLAPKELVDAILGSRVGSLDMTWRFENSLPTRVVLEGPNRTRLTLNLEDPELEAPGPEAFVFGAGRTRVLSLEEMSRRLGLTR